MIPPERHSTCGPARSEVAFALAMKCKDGDIQAGEATESTGFSSFSTSITNRVTFVPGSNQRTELFELTSQERNVSKYPFQILFCGISCRSLVSKRREKTPKPVQYLHMCMRISSICLRPLSMPQLCKRNILRNDACKQTTRFLLSNH